MMVKLKSASPLDLAIDGARVCYLSKSDYASEDYDLLRRIIKKGHESVIEHVVFTFEIDDLSRACLHELVRHRIASYSVQSTRYTLKKLLKDERLDVSIYLVSSGSEDVDRLNRNTLKELRRLALEKDLPNDVLKYGLPEAFKIRLIWTINARSLRNFITLRTAKKAHREIRTLALEIVKLLKNTEYYLLIKDLIEDDDED